jgi:anti-sigma factor RsiW
MNHPSDTAIAAYTRGTLAPDELLALDDHLASCEACRARADALARGRGWRPDLREELLAPDSHLTDAQLAAVVDARLAPGERDEVETHLRACSTCAGEVEDLRAFARGRSRGPRVRYIWAAAAALVGIALLIPAAIQWRSRSGGQAVTEASLAGLETLPARERQRVQAALGSGVAQAPAWLAELGPAPEALMGEAPPESFRIVAPVATAVVEDRPAFRWQALPGATGYEVAISDEALRVVAHGGPVTGTSWTPDQPLARGRVYLWQVTAHRGGESVSAPAPPAPVAKFRVLDQGTARVLDDATRAHPEADLLLGILYTEAGVRDTAIARLVRVPPADPHFPMAARTLDVLRASSR